MELMQPTDTLKERSGEWPHRSDASKMQPSADLITRFGRGKDGTLWELARGKPSERDYFRSENVACICR